MSDNKKLTQEEADKMISMLKKTLKHGFEFPNQGKSIEFDVVGNTKKDLFTTKIYRGKINPYKYDIGARITKNGIPLLELHINPSNVHINPDGTKVTGSHWHIYDEKYGRKFAFEAGDIKGNEFIENTILFLNKFNVVEKPFIYSQYECFKQ